MSGITFQQMRDVITFEAERIGIVQRALVQARMRKAPDPGQMQMKAVLEAVDRLIGIVVSDQVILDRLKQRARDAQLQAQHAAAEKAGAG